MANIASFNLKEMPRLLVANYFAGVNTFMQGKPAIGKTVMTEEFAERMRTKLETFEFFRFYAPTMSPMDIVASAPDYEKGTLRNFHNELLPNAYKTPDMKGAVFFGEMPNADPATLKLLQKYCNGEDMGGLKKPEGVVIIADGNRLEDKSGVQQHGRAFLSRFEQIEVFSTAQDNIDFAGKHTWHPNVQTFFKDNPALIDNYDDVFETGEAALQRGKNAANNDGATNGKRAAQVEEGKRGIWANMRSWERISKKEYVGEQMTRPVTLAEIAANVGSAVAAQYEAHRKIIASLASLEQILANPQGAKVPTRIDEQYMLAMQIALRCKNTDLDAVHAYCSRMPNEMQAVVLRQLSARKNFGLAATPAYMKWITNAELAALVTGR